MKHTESPLLEFEDSWKTTLGGSVTGERVVVHGRNLFEELNDYSWLKLLLFMITEREFNQNELEMLDKLWTFSVSYPDPRVWNNRVSALAGTAGSTPALAVGAASAVSEAKIYGGQAILGAFDFIVDCKNKIDSGQKLDDIIRQELKINRAVYGYGRPIVKRDELIAPFEKVMRKLGFDQGDHVKLIYQIEDILKNGRWRMQMNIAALSAAIGADMGLSAKEYYLWTVNSFNAGITACFLDANNKMPGALFPVRCKRIKYEGVAKRKWNDIK
ncbi:MAG: hypothetical protein AAF372_02090 [Pseudomonadota bacterium]